MVRKSFLMVIVILSALLLIGSDARPAQLVQGLAEAQNVPAIANDGEQMQFFDVAPGGVPIIVFTVPDGNTFVLTDALFSKDTLGGAKTLVAKIFRSTGSKTCDPNGPGFQGEDLFTAYVKPEENVAYNFKTGYEFSAGERVCYLGTVTGGGNSISFSLLGVLNLASEVSDQPSEPVQDLSSSFKKGWKISTFANIEFEDAVWNLVEENGVCNTYRSEPKGEHDPASVVVFQPDSVTIFSYPNFGARIKVCNTTVFLPDVGTGIRITDDD